MGTYHPAIGYFRSCLRVPFILQTGTPYPVNGALKEPKPLYLIMNLGLKHSKVILNNNNGLTEMSLVV